MTWEWELLPVGLVLILAVIFIFIPNRINNGKRRMKNKQFKNR